jgi:hypothetical protein
MKQAMVACSLLAVLCTGSDYLSAQEKNQTPLAVEYERSIRPLLAKHCNSCHGGAKPKGGIELSSRKGNEKPHAWKEVWERLRSRREMGCSWDS